MMVFMIIRILWFTLRICCPRALLNEITFNRAKGFSQQNVDTIYYLHFRVHKNHKLVNWWRVEPGGLYLFFFLMYMSILLICMSYISRAWSDHRGQKKGLDPRSIVTSNGECHNMGAGIWTCAHEKRIRVLLTTEPPSPHPGWAVSWTTPLYVLHFLSQLVRH